MSDQRARDAVGGQDLNNQNIHHACGLYGATVKPQTSRINPMHIMMILIDVYVDIEQVLRSVQLYMVCR